MEAGQGSAFIDDHGYESDSVTWILFSSGLEVELPEREGIAMSLVIDADLASNLIRLEETHLAIPADATVELRYLDQVFETDFSDPGTLVITDFGGDGGTLTGCFAVDYNEDISISTALFVAEAR
jgi:hypothetical protein